MTPKMSDDAVQPFNPYGEALIVGHDATALEKRDTLVKN